MTCAEFQKVLPYIIETGGKEQEEEHLRSCAICSDLVQDLTYIAEQAKLLLPMRDPNPRVWKNIRDSLEKEGFLRPHRFARLVGTATKAGATRWTGLSWAAGLATVLMIGAMWWSNHRTAPATAGQPQARQAANPVPASQQVPPLENEAGPADEQLLHEVSTAAPAVQDLYRQNLKRVNAYIRDAQQQVAQDPEDAEAHEYLMHAYQQKAMLYEMALQHTQ